MEISSTIETGHEDLIHDVAFDFYGRRIATCSSDHRIRIYNLQQDGSHKLTGEIKKKHSGSVWRVAWAHPEYGQVIASCSIDHTAKIWEEQEGIESDGLESNWLERATMSDSKTSVTGIAFAPRHLGLRLATCAEDGQIRIYEAMDVMNLMSWSQLEDFKAQGKGNCKCLSWNPSRGCTMLAIGCGGADSTNSLQVWELGSAKHWTPVLEDLGSLNCTVYDVAFAPTMGRTYYLLAAACSDGHVRIWKISAMNNLASTAVNLTSRTQCDAEEVMCSPNQPGNVWRVSWNVTGTTLASSGDDGSVKLWAQLGTGEWKQTCIIQEDAQGQREPW